jgi:hypothetical protein
MQSCNMVEKWVLNNLTDRENCVQMSGAPMGVPVCLRPPWHENLHRLVSLWDIIMTFDAGKLSTVMMFLAQTRGAFGVPGLENLLFSSSEEHRQYVLGRIQSYCMYCDEAAFPMTKIPLERALTLAADSTCTMGMIADLMANAMERLRDEASSRVLLPVPSSEAIYYRAFTADSGSPNNLIEQNWQPVFDSFPSVKYDATEAFKCYALSRYTACVFHLMRVLELGLGALGAIFNVSLAHTNWKPAIDQIEKRIRVMHEDPAWKSHPDCREQQEFYAQAASHFAVLKDAWRNFTAHSRGKYDSQEAEDIMTGVRAFMQKLTVGGLHE